MTEPLRQLLTPSEVADLLQLSKATIYRLAESGDLPAIRIGRAVRFRREAIEQLLNGQGVTAVGGRRNPPAFRE